MSSPALPERIHARLVQEAERRRWLRVAGEVLSPRQREVRANRHRLAKTFLAGQGLEIGALHLPLPLPRGAHARYVDRMSREDLRRHYPEMRTYDLVEVDVIDDGETLATVADGSQDFVIANHFIEHTQDPIATIGNHFRVLKPGGVLFMAVPDKRRTFDVDRPVTTLEHHIADHRDGPQHSRAQHYVEWATHIERDPSKAQALEEADYSIHFHVFTPDSFAALLGYCRDEAGIPLAVEAIVPSAHEFVTVLRRWP
jgi:predicted SAM-dependent methyltransferase